MKRGARSRRQGYLWILSLVVVGSMICSVVVMIRPPRTAPTPTPRPTRLIPTWTPTPRPTVPLPPPRRWLPKRRVGPPRQPRLSSSRRQSQLSPASLRRNRPRQTLATRDRDPGGAVGPAHLPAEPARYIFKEMRRARPGRASRRVARPHALSTPARRRHLGPDPLDRR